MSSKNKGKLSLPKLRAKKSGERIRKHRKESGETQSHLAKKMQKGDHSTISTWESGRSSPTIDEFIKMAKMFNVNVGYLMALDVITQKREIEEKIQNQLAERQSVADEVNSNPPDQGQSSVNLLSAIELIQRYLQEIDHNS